MKIELLENAKLIDEERSLYHSTFSIAGLETEIYILKMHENSLEDVVEGHIQSHFKDGKLCIDSYCHADETVPRGRNIVHIVDV